MSDDDLFGSWAADAAAKLVLDPQILDPGDSLGPFTIRRRIGAGGMGTVYEAEDTRLLRSVALKVMNGNHQLDADWRDRLTSEARAAARLKHPNVCAVYDVGCYEGIDVLVMELVKGTPLSERIAKGPLPLNQALDIASAIASALAEAHSHGVVHCDVKPENILLTRGGPKLLDFGIALWLKEVENSAELSGTPAYMAPESMTGEIDARADIFALGAVLQEMITGQRFDRGAAPTAASIPPSLRVVMDSCLAADPAERWQSAADLARALRWCGEFESPKAKRPVWFWWLAAALSALLLSGAFLLLPRATQSQPVSFELYPPPGNSFRTRFEISPDGRTLLFRAVDQQGNALLWTRSLNEAAAKPLSATAGARVGFWSPDGRQIGFGTDTKLKILDLSSGASRTLCQTGPLTGGSWGRNGGILYSYASLRREGVIRRIGEDGTGNRTVTALNLPAEEHTHLSPRFLSDGEHFVYTALSNRDMETSRQSGAVYVGRLGSDERKLILRGSGSVMAGGDRLFYLRNGRLLGRKFNLTKSEWSGEETQASPELTMSGFALSGTGVLVHWPLSQNAGKPTWVDRTGRALGELAIEGKDVVGLALSNDGRHAVFAKREDNRAAMNLWSANATSAQRLTSCLKNCFFPVWSPDGNSIYFTFTEREHEDIYRQKLGLSSQPELIYQSPGDSVLETISPDGRYALGVTYQHNKTSGFDIFLLDLKSGASRDWKATPLSETQPRISPDGRWVAYVCELPGKWTMCLSPFEDPGRVFPLNTDGGSRPAWRGDGREIFFVDKNGWLAAAPVETRGGQTARIGEPKQLFRAPPTGEGYTYAAAPDGQRFLLVSQPAPEPVPVVTVGWKPLQ